MPQIHKYGFIVGGACEKRIMWRKSRAGGARMAWDELCLMKFVKINKGWYEIKQIQDKRFVGNPNDAQWEIGYLRMLQIVFASLKKEKRKFRLKDMNIWIEAIASAEFGISQDSPLSIITPGEKIAIGLTPPKPNDDAIYEKMFGVKRGLLKYKR